MSCMKCHHAHIPSHSPIPSHMPMPSVTTVTGSTNDIHIPSLYRFTSTHYKCHWATRPESIPTPITQLEVYVLFVFLNFRQQNFSAYTAGLLLPYINFGSCRGSLTPMFQAFHLRRLTTPFLLHPTHIDYYFTLCFEPWVIYWTSSKIRAHHAFTKNGE